MSVTLREDHVLRVCKSRVLRKVFGLKRDDVTAEWRRLHNEKLLICTYLLTPWSRVLLEKLTSKLCS